MHPLPSAIRHPPSAIATRFRRGPIMAVMFLLWLAVPAVRAQDQAEPLKLGGMITTASVEFGLRQALIGGNQDVYRSNVNLGSGVRLFDASMESRAPDNTGPIYDYLSYSMSSWGGDPYNTMRLRLERHHRYRFDFKYWRINYVNLLPTFANPLLGQGVQINQHSFNKARRTASYTLTVFPDTGFQIRLGYDRNHASGQALTTFSVGLDEFVLGDPVRTTTDEYLVGVDARLGKVDLTFEQDVRTFKDDIATFQLPGIINVGNNPNRAPVGARDPQQILLSSFNRNNGVRGFIPATRLALNARPVGQLQLTGRFVYSDANIDFDRDELLTGTLFDLSALSFFTRQTATTAAETSKPTTLADAGINYRPIPRLTLTNSTQFSHFVIAGASLLRTLQILSVDFQGNPVPPDRMQRIISSVQNERTFLNSYRNLFEASYEALPQLTLRGGYRFTRRRTVLDIPQPVVGLIREDESRLKTHTGIAGLSLRAANKFRLFTQVERGSADNVFTRIAPYHVTRLRVRSSFQPLDTWRVHGQFLLSDARNPNPFVDNLQRSRAFNLTSSWFPNERLGVDLGYTRSDVSSLTDIVNPRTLQTGRSVYIADDNAVDADINWAPVKAAQVSVGYSIINSQGTFPLNYHQPRARFSYDFARRFAWIVSWRWYGYNEKGTALQDYRAHLVTASARINF
jgi:hypothetical protein